MLAREPEWTRFDESHKFTIAVKNYYTNPDLGGGPLTGDLTSPNVDGPIRTPLVGMVEDINHYGYYELNKI